MDLITDLTDAGLLAGLFLGALLDALPGPCLFVFGEVFFIAAGGLLHQSGSPWPVLAVFAGALTADQLGYWLGGRLAKPLRRMVLARASRRAAWRRTRAGLERRAILFVGISRLLGPVAWITPTVAGSLQIGRARFSAGSLLGVFVGVGQFVVYGWLMSAGADLAGLDIGGLVADHALAILVVANGTALAGLVIWRRLATRRPTVPRDPQ